MCQAADQAFIAFVFGQGSWREFKTARQMANIACREGVAKLRTSLAKSRYGGPFPTWFRKRLVRALGPELFNHHNLHNMNETPGEHSRQWLRCPIGVTTAYVPSVISTPLGPENVYAEQKVFCFEMLRPWVFDRNMQHGSTLTNLTSFAAARMRGVFLDMLKRQLAEPRRFAEHTRCDLVVQRMAHTGWHNIRLMFIPWNINEPAERTPDTMVLNKCRCLKCNRRKAKLNGWPVPRTMCDYMNLIDNKGNKTWQRTKTYDPQG
jgi:hypothetical protein